MCNRGPTTSNNRRSTYSRRRPTPDGIAQGMARTMGRGPAQYSSCNSTPCSTRVPHRFMATGTGLATASSLQDIGKVGCKSTLGDCGVHGPKFKATVWLCAKLALSPRGICVISYVKRSKIVANRPTSAPSSGIWTYTLGSCCSPKTIRRLSTASAPSA